MLRWLKTVVVSDEEKAPERRPSRRRRDPLRQRPRPRLRHRDGDPGAPAGGLHAPGQARVRRGAAEPGRGDPDPPNASAYQTVIMVTAALDAGYAIPGQAAAGLPGAVACTIDPRVQLTLSTMGAAGRGNANPGCNRDRLTCTAIGWSRLSRWRMRAAPAGPCSSPALHVDSDRGTLSPGPSQAMVVVKAAALIEGGALHPVGGQKSELA
ncbi:MAG: hypothetical protein ACRDOH_06680 [Streptosporangiaceae bacterium]